MPLRFYIAGENTAYIVFQKNRQMALHFEAIFAYRLVGWTWLAVNAQTFPAWEEEKEEDETFDDKEDESSIWWNRWKQIILEKLLYIELSYLKNICLKFCHIEL